MNGWLIFTYDYVCVYVFPLFWPCKKKQIIKLKDGRVHHVIEYINIDVVIKYFNSSDSSKLPLSLYPV